jgi:hypothetical protein
MSKELAPVIEALINSLADISVSLRLQKQMRGVEINGTMSLLKNPAL